jgi:hypothetical protein
MTAGAPSLFQHDHYAQQTLTPFGLRDALKRELDAASPEAPHYLVALVELGGLDEDVRQTFLTGHSPGAHTHTLFFDEKLGGLAPWGPMLISHENGAQALLDDLGDYDGGTVSAWIISILPPAELARYLGNFTIARHRLAVDNQYAVRFYAPETLPTLHKLANRRWLQRLFEPIVRWWYPVATTQSENWSNFPGESKQPEAKYFHLRRWLPMDEDLWDALESDPLPYRLTDTLQETSPTLFKSDCYGVRVAQVETLLAEARQHGLQTDTDLMTYVWYLLARPTLPQDPYWHDALQRAVRDKTPLSQTCLEHFAQNAT